MALQCSKGESSQLMNSTTLKCCMHKLTFGLAYADCDKCGSLHAATTAERWLLCASSAGVVRASWKTNASSTLQELAEYKVQELQGHMPM